MGDDVIHHLHKITYTDALNEDRQDFCIAKVAECLKNLANSKNYDKDLSFNHFLQNVDDVSTLNRIKAEYEIKIPIYIYRELCFYKIWDKPFKATYLSEEWYVPKKIKITNKEIETEIRKTFIDAVNIVNATSTLAYSAFVNAGLDEHLASWMLQQNHYVYITGPVNVLNVFKAIECVEVTDDEHLTSLEFLKMIKEDLTKSLPALEYLYRRYRHAN